MNSIEIERVNNMKFLGIIINNKLTRYSHIDKKSKISKTIGILHKMKGVINKNSLHILYCSLLLPLLTYCVEVWGKMYKTIM